MSHSLLLPPYHQVAKYEGTGNFAVKKYYDFPYSFFYQKKLKMILSFMDRKYRDILDFGSGEAEIFKPTLKQFSKDVTCVDTDFRCTHKFDLIICASVLEFTYLGITKELKNMLLPTGVLIGASPMDNFLTRAYFSLIKDRKYRNSKNQILNQLREDFVVETKNWFGLYFSFKASPK